MMTKERVEEMRGLLAKATRFNDPIVIRLVEDCLALHEREERLRAALELAAEKVRLYRKNSSGEYVGGMEYTMLMKKIDAALKAEEG